MAFEDKLKTLEEIVQKMGSGEMKLDEKLKKEASLLSSVDYSLGELNTETHTVPVTLKVVPKSLTDDMQLSVKIGSETVALERNGNEFSC